MNVLQATFADGNVSLIELLIIAQIAAKRRPAHIFEIGTFDGRTTLNLAANAGAESRVWTLDLPEDQLSSTVYALQSHEEGFVRKQRSGARFSDTEFASQITQLYGDSAHFDISPYRQKMDLIFVDGSHAYEYVLNDTRVALELARPGATILWHDYDHGQWPGVTRALNDFRKQEPRLAGIYHVEGTTLAIATPG